jgi:hypothetical protein
MAGFPKGGARMITLRSLVLLVPVLLVGCATGCPLPGHPSPINERCFYVLKVTHIDAASNEVKARMGRGGYETNEEFSFRVKDIDKLVATNQLKVGDDKHIFGSLSGSPYLELYTTETQKKVIDELKKQQKDTTIDP